MALKEVAKAAGSQPIGLGEMPGGGAHGDAERDLGGAQASMVAAGREGAPPGARRGQMARDHGVWKDAQAVRSQPTGPGKVHLRAWPPAGEVPRVHFGGDGGHLAPQPQLGGRRAKRRQRRRRSSLGGDVGGGEGGGSSAREGRAGARHV
jgi:hypothetical protein